MARTRAQTKETDPLSSGSSSGSGSPSKSTRSTSRKREVIINDVPSSIYIRRILIGSAASIITMAVLTWLVWTNRISLTGNVAVDKISGFGSRLELTLRFLILPVLWLLINDIIVMATRCVNLEALDPLNEREDIVEVGNNVLRNSIEQLILSVLAQLSLISYLSASETVKVIPLMNVTFLVGRVTYYLGYPKFRTYGFTMTVLPTAAAISFAVYKFITITFLPV